MDKDSIGGASASLNRTITEIMEFLGDRGPRPGGRGARLREFLHEKLANLAEKRYRRGFRRGHIESHKKFVKTGVFPRELRFVGEREFFKDQKRKVDVTSRINTKP
ncbi:MAG: hypothetical protein ACLP3K_18280 [Candidatus Acidiferrales bacterium]